VRVGVVTDDVPETNKVSAFVVARVSEHSFERFEIGVNVTKNGEAHWRNINS
jgi:hypothetical protein